MKAQERGLWPGAATPGGQTLDRTRSSADDEMDDEETEESYGIDEGGVGKPVESRRSMVGSHGVGLKSRSKGDNVVLRNNIIDSCPDDLCDPVYKVAVLLCSELSAQERVDLVTRRQ